LALNSWREAAVLGARSALVAWCDNALHKLT